MVALGRVVASILLSQCLAKFEVVSRIYIGMEAAAIFGLSLAIMVVTSCLVFVAMMCRVNMPVHPF
jgi:hypothetical protein